MHRYNVSTGTWDSDMDIVATLDSEHDWESTELREQVESMLRGRYPDARILIQDVCLWTVTLSDGFTFDVYVGS